PPARRADRRRGPAEPQRHLREPGVPEKPRQGAALHDPLHGRGRADGRPHRGDGPRPRAGRRHAGGAARPRRSRRRPRRVARIAVPGHDGPHLEGLMAMAPLAALVRKDLQIFFTDRRAVILTLAIPIAIASFFGSLFQGQGDQEAARVAVAIVDQDGSGLSKRLITATAADKALAVTQPSLDEARAAVLAGRLGVAVVIPAGFGDAAVRAFIGQGQNAQLELLTDPSKGAEVAMVRGLLTGHVMGAVTQEAFTGPSSQRLLDDGIKSLETSDMPADQRERLRRVFESVQALNRNQQTTGA